MCHPLKRGPSFNHWMPFWVMMIAKRQNYWIKQRIKVYSVLAIVIISRMAFKPNSVSILLIQPSSATVFWSVLPVGCRHSFYRCHYFYEWILTSLLIHALQPSPNSTPTHPQLHRVYPHQDRPSFECTQLLFYQYVKGTELPSVMFSWLRLVCHLVIIWCNVPCGPDLNGSSNIFWCFLELRTDRRLPFTCSSAA